MVVLSNELIAKEAELAIQEGIVEATKKRIFALQMKELPDAMTEIGLSNITLTNGAQVKVAPFYQCSISEEETELKTKALKWLRTNGAGALIKHEFKCALGVEAEKMVASLRGFLNRHSVPFKDGQSVNAAKLKSYMKECIEGAKPFPMDIFRGYSGKKATVVNSKK